MHFHRINPPAKKNCFLAASLLILSAIPAIWSPGMARADFQSPIVLQGKQVAVHVERNEEGGFCERFSALRDGKWIEVAVSDGQSIGPLSVLPEDRKPLQGSVRNVSLVGEVLVEELDIGPHRATRKIMIDDDGPWIRVVTRIEPSGPLVLRQAFDRFKFLHKPTWSFSPSVGGFNPDAQYKAPLILAQADQAALGIVPDLAVLDRDALRRCNHALDLDVPVGPKLAVGFMPAKEAYHSVYSIDADRTWTLDRPVENAYYLLVTAIAEPGQAFRQAVRFHWTRFGRAQQAIAAGQQQGTDPRYQKLTLWDEWRKTVWTEESRATWLSVTLPDGSTGGGALTRRWGPGPSVYLSSWFNTLRTSYGMSLYAQRAGNDELLKLASQTVNLALQAPGKDGAFKCIAVPTEGGKNTLWAAGDGGGGSTQDGFLGYDMCWTGYWLLKWRDAGLSQHDHILARCRELAGFMITRQESGGMFPTRFAEDGSVETEASRKVKAETGAVLLFLLELYKQDPNPDYLASAKKAMLFLQREVIPLRQWYDFETFWSCSPRDARFDARSGQWPANDLALTQTVAAYLLAHRITGDPQYLETGVRLLDYLLLYQQCWTNPVIDGLTSPAMLLGGFTSQNSDAEWSDARQSQIGNILLDYYRATGNVEYLERGIAALRAQFPVSPSENWAHTGYGGKAGVSSFHWGTGSGMAGIEIEEDFLRDAVVDVRATRAIGVNGLNVTRCTIKDTLIDLEIDTPFAWPRQPVAVFFHVEPQTAYQIRLNGAAIGSWKGADLKKGLPLPLQKDSQSQHDQTLNQRQ
jgi:hypothetical protein